LRLPEVIDKGHMMVVGLSALHTSLL